MSKRLIYSALLLILLPVGLSTKFYSGVAADWVYDYGGDILYPMFWFFLLKAIWPELSSWKTAVAVFVFCICVEISQLFDVPLLRWGRRYFLGRVLLGTDFSFTDMIYYAVGCFSAAVLDSGIDRWRTRRSSTSTCSF
jgi:hypothetical protein